MFRRHLRYLHGALCQDLQLTDTVYSVCETQVCACSFVGLYSAVFMQSPVSELLSSWSSCLFFSVDIQGLGINDLHLDFGNQCVCRYKNKNRKGVETEGCV